MIADLKQNPRTLPDIAKLYFRTETHPNGSYKRAHRRVMKLMKRGALRRSSGRVDDEIINLYSTKIISAAEHEYRLTKVCDVWREHIVARGKNLPHEADAKARNGNQVAWIEQDCGSEGKRQTRQRLTHYSALPKGEVVVFICPDAERAAAIQALAPQEVKGVLYTVLFDEVIRDPYGKILTDCEGVKDTLWIEEKREEDHEESSGEESSDVTLR